MLAEFWVFMHILSSKIRSDKFWRWLFWTKRKTQVVSLFLMESASSSSLLIQCCLRLFINSFVNFLMGYKCVGLWCFLPGLFLECLCLKKHVCLPLSFNLLPHPYASYLPLGHAGFEADWYLKHWQRYCTVKFSQLRYKLNCWISGYKQV